MAFEYVPLIEKYGYLATFVGAVIEGESLLVLSGLAANRGHLSLPLVVLVGAVGGRHAGQRWRRHRDAEPERGCHRAAVDNGGRAPERLRRSGRTESGEVAKRTNRSTTDRPFHRTNGLPSSWTRSALRAGLLDRPSVFLLPHPILVPSRSLRGPEIDGKKPVDELSVDRCAHAIARAELSYCAGQPRRRRQRSSPATERAAGLDEINE